MRFLFSDYTLDADRRELCRDGKPLHVEPQVFDLLLHLLRNRNRVVSKDDLLANVWSGRIVSESTLSNRVNAARRALGDSGVRQHFIKTVARRGLRFVGEVREEVPKNETAASGGARAIEREPAFPVALPQEVTFCRAVDGVNLAVGTSGSGLPVVKAANWLNHIEFDWQSPVWSPMLNLLSEKFRLIRYDERGTGLSDRTVKDLSFEVFVRDLEAVVDNLGLERFALLGISQGAAVSVAYAARHPERVSRLVLLGGYAIGWRKDGDPGREAQFEALTTMMRKGWDRDNPAFRQVFTSLFIPGATEEEEKWFNELARASTSAENAIRLLEAFSLIDVTDLLPRVTAPTLVLHSRNDATIPFEWGRSLARGIPNARLVALESNNHVVLSHEPAWRRFTEEVCAFLGEDEKS